jgi:hypothetical protein
MEWREIGSCNRLPVDRSIAAIGISIAYTCRRAIRCNQNLPAVTRRAWNLGR